MADAQQTPAGWYPDANQPGMQRYWDGAKWTDSVAPVAPQGAPPAPAAVPRRRGRGCLWAVLAVVGVFVVLIIVVIAVGGSSKNNNSVSNNLGGAAPAAAYKVGQTANTSGFKITVYAFKNPQPSKDQFSTPQAGNHFVSVDVQVTNPGSNQQTFSSLIGFHLLDSKNRQYDEDVTGAGLTPGPPDGQIAGGQSIRGFVVFQVPNGTTGPLRFRAQGSITAAGAVWTL